MRVGNAAAQVPTAVLRDLVGGQFGRMQREGPLVCALVPVDAVAALAAAAGLPCAEQAAGAVCGDLQGAAGTDVAGAAVPVAIGSRNVGAHGGDRARRHAVSPGVDEDVSP
jgi:hypothetical protein